MSDHAHNTTQTHKGSACDPSRPLPNQSVQIPNKNQAKPHSLSNIRKINRYKIASLSRRARSSESPVQIDGYTLPSKNAATPFTPTSPRELMATEIAVTLTIAQPCNCRSDAPSASRMVWRDQDRHPERSIAKRRNSWLATRHCIFDRYTCRTKNAVRPAASSKLPNLIDTLADPMRIGILSGASRSEGSQPAAIIRSDDPGFSPTQLCNVVLHACGARQNLSVRVLRDFPRKPNPINKTAEISRHVFASDQDANPESEHREPKAPSAAMPDSPTKRGATRPTGGRYRLARHNSKTPTQRCRAEDRGATFRHCERSLLSNGPRNQTESLPVPQYY